MNPVFRHLVPFSVYLLCLYSTLKGSADCKARMMKPTFMILAFLLFFTTEVTGADNESVKFIFPPAGLTFNYMDTVNVSYISRYPKPVLYTFCTKANSKKPLKSIVYCLSLPIKFELIVFTYRTCPKRPTKELNLPRPPRLARCDFLLLRPPTQ